MLSFEKNNLLPRVLELRSELNFPVIKNVYDNPEKDHDEAIGTVPEVFVEVARMWGPRP